GKILVQPLSELLDRGNVVRAGVVVALSPAFNLALHVALRGSEITEACSFVIDRVYLREIVDEGFRQTLHQRRWKIEAMWFLCTQDNSGHALHHVERRTEYRLIIAKQKRPRHFMIDRVQVRKDPVLAAHVVRGFDLCADRRTSQDELAIAGAD